MIKYYIATSLKNHEEHNKLRDYIDSVAGRAFNLTYDWTSHGSVLGDTRDVRIRIANAEIEAVKASEVLIVVLPGRYGTHVELGVALATNTPVILLVPDNDPLQCVFYDHPSVYGIVNKTEGPQAVLDAMKDVVQKLYT